MRMRLMLLGGGNALGQALIRLGAEEDIAFLAPRPPENGWAPSSLTQLLDDHRPDALVNLAYLTMGALPDHRVMDVPLALHGIGGAQSCQSLRQRRPLDQNRRDRSAAGRARGSPPRQATT